MAALACVKWNHTRRIWVCTGRPTALSVDLKLIVILCVSTSASFQQISTWKNFIQWSNGFFNCFMKGRFMVEIIELTRSFCDFMSVPQVAEKVYTANALRAPQLPVSQPGVVPLKGLRFQKYFIYENIHFLNTLRMRILQKTKSQFFHRQKLQPPLNPLTDEFFLRVQ